MNFEIFASHLTELGILQEQNGDLERIHQIYVDIDDNEIQSA